MALLLDLPILLVMAALIIGLAVFWSTRSSYSSAPRQSQADATRPLSVTQAVSMRLNSIPATINAGRPPVQFAGTLTNDSRVTRNDVAPLLQIASGPCNCALGSLERFETARVARQVVPMAGKER